MTEEDRHQMGIIRHGESVDDNDANEYSLFSLKGETLSPSNIDRPRMTQQPQLHLTAYTARVLSTTVLKPNKQPLSWMTTHKQFVSFQG